MPAVTLPASWPLMAVLIYPIFFALSVGFNHIQPLSNVGLWLSTLLAFNLSTCLYLPLGLYFDIGGPNTLILFLGTYTCLCLGFFNSPQVTTTLHNQHSLIFWILSTSILIITYIVLHVIYRFLFTLLRYWITPEAEDRTWFGYWDHALVGMLQMLMGVFQMAWKEVLWIYDLTVYGAIHVVRYCFLDGLQQYFVRERPQVDVGPPPYSLISDIDSEVIYRMSEKA